MRGKSYSELAYAVLSRFIDDIPADDLRALIARTYTPAVFGDAAITPLAKLEPGLSLLRVSGGPTLSFKDIALQLLGQLFDYTLERGQRRVNILGATSGDTGSAAEVAMLGKDRVAVFMLSPRGRMSAFQQAQMYTLDAPNIHNLAIDGTFDECQDIVKEVNSDVEFKARHAIGAVNSINWARIAAQAVYYFSGYFAATRANDVPVDFAVPSGNFGNVLAGYVARAMGLPIRRLIVATNENDVLDEFFRTGVYRPRAGDETHATSSPSMDISKASNFERYIFDIVGRDPGALRALWDGLAREGQFTLRDTPYWAAAQASDFRSGRSTHADRLRTIRHVDRHYRLLVDPHTADGIKVGQDFRDPSVPLVCVETALPVKFEQIIMEALGRAPERPLVYRGLEEKTQHATALAADARQVKSYIAEHSEATTLATKTTRDRSAMRTP
jgi:threonine synthase